MRSIYLTASRPLWPPRIELDSQRTLLSDKLCILFPKDRLAHLAMTPKKVDPVPTGTCLSTLNPTSSTCGLLPPWPKESRNSLAFDNFQGRPKQPFLARGRCLIPNTRNKKILHWAIFISSGPQTSNKTSWCGYIKIVESSPMSFLLHTRCFLSDCQRLPWSGCTSKWNEKKKSARTEGAGAWSSGWHS